MKMMVYGTLKKNYWNNHFLAGATYLGEAFTQKTYSMFGTRVPYIVPNKEGLPVKGEVFEIDVNRHLESIDRLEGHPHGYTRTNIMARLVSTGELEEVAIYEMVNSRYFGDLNTGHVTMKGYHEWNI